MGNRLGEVLRGVWARRPLFCVAVVMVVAMLMEGLLGGAGWFLGLLVGMGLVVVCGWRAGLLCAGLVWLGMLSLKWRDEEYDGGRKWVEEQGFGMVEGRLLEDAREGEGGGWSAVVKLHGSGFPGRNVVWVGAGEPPVAGTEVKAMGVFKGLEAERNPGDGGSSVRLRAEGVVGYFLASEMRQERWTGPYARRLGDVRRAFRESIVRGLGEESEEAVVVRAVVLGERSPDALELVAKFRDSGTLHVFSVSGLHVAMVGSLVWLFLRIVRCSRSYAVMVIIGAMFGYVWLVGNGPAAVRSACMGAVFLMAFVLRRRPDLLNSLGVVLVGSILWNPALLWLPGVQLSYGVVAAIGLGTGLARRCFVWIAEEERFLPKSEEGFLTRMWLGFRRWLADGLAVSLAATVGSTPLGMFHFGILTPVSIFATVALVPLVYVLLGVALVSGLVHPLVPGASALLNRGNGLVAKVCIETAGMFASIPGAHGRSSSVREETLVIYDLSFGAAAACFAAPGRKAVMIDCGGNFGMKGEVGMSLRNLGMIPDSVIFTHVDSGHVAAVETMREMFPLRQVVLGMDATRGTAAGWYRAGEEGMRVVVPKRGDVFELGNGERMEVLFSPHEEVLGSEADDRVMVLMLHWRGWRILWLGDAGRLTEMWLVENGVNVKADVIVAGCHESDFSLTEAFLKEVDAQAIIVPRLPGGEMDAFRRERMRRLSMTDLKLIDQDLAGGVLMTINASGKLVMKGFLDGSSVELERD